MSGVVILEEKRMMRSLVGGCGAAATSKPWGMKRAASRIQVPRHRHRSWCGQMLWSRSSTDPERCWTPSTDPERCWTLRGTSHATPVALRSTSACMMPLMSSLCSSYLTWSLTFFFSFAVFIPSASASCSIHILGWNLINYLFIYLFTNYLRSHYQLNAISVCLMCEPNEPPKWPACAKEETMDEWIWIEYKRIEQKAIELNWAICICQNIHEIWFLHLIDHSSGHSKHNNCVTSQEQVVARRVVRVICVLLKGTAAVNPEG